MIGKFIGAALGRRAARTIGTSIGGPAGAAIGYGLASRRLRKFAFGGLAVAGGLAAYRRMKEARGTPGHPRTVHRMDAPAQESTNDDPLPAYAPHSS